MPVLIVVPPVTSKLGSFWLKKNWKSSKIMFFYQKCCFSEKKSSRQGCTKPKTKLGMHQNPYFQQNPLKINENPKINLPSTITIPESAYLCLFLITLSQEDEEVSAIDAFATLRKSQSPAKNKVRPHLTPRLRTPQQRTFVPPAGYPLTLAWVWIWNSCPAKGLVNPCKRYDFRKGTHARAM